MRYKIKGTKLRNRQGLTYGRIFLRGRRTNLYRLKNGNWVQKYKKSIKCFKKFE